MDHKLLPVKVKLSTPLHQKSDKMGMRRSFINIRTKGSCVLHSILGEI